jgi:hypothetical protein
MFLEIPFTYSARIIRPRSTATVTVEVLDRAAVEIPELADSEAPIAAFNFRHRPGIIGYRMSPAGLMMKPATEDLRNLYPWTFLTAVKARGRLDTWYEKACAGNTEPYSSLPSMPPCRGGVPAAIIDARRWISDNRDETTSAIRTAYKQASAVVDGVLFVPSGGPGWTVSIDPACPSDGISFTAADDVETYTWNFQAGLMGVFRGDEAAAAEEFASAAAARLRRATGKYLGQPTRDGEIIALRPEAFRSDSRRISSLTAAMQTDQTLSRLATRHFPASALRILADLKDMLANTDASSADLETCLSALTGNGYLPYPGASGWPKGLAPWHWPELQQGIRDNALQGEVFEAEICSRETGLPSL